MKNVCRDFHFQTQTNIWTGDAEQKSCHLANTGLIGSIRWWFEALVRGLGGAACDPTNTKCSDEKHCTVCELFGCTGWAHKFRFEVLNENQSTRMDKNDNEPKYSPPIKTNEKFIFRFTPLRPICEKEWALLEATLRLIAEYGAIGGKTVLKPSDELDRAGKPQHQDYGIIELIRPFPSIKHFSRQDLEKYVRSDRWKKPVASNGNRDFSWASLQNFWCVKERYLTRETVDKSSFNYVIGRPESKDQSKKNNHSWLAGSQQESKKVFSFKTPARTFGFVKPGLITLDTMKQRLRGVWGQDVWDFIEEDEILNSLFSGMEENK